MAKQKAARMRRLVAQWRQSGESQAGFARRHGIPTWTFWYLEPQGVGAGRGGAGGGGAGICADPRDPGDRGRCRRGGVPLGRAGARRRGCLG